MLQNGGESYNIWRLFIQYDNMILAIQVRIRRGCYWLWSHRMFGAARGWPHDAHWLAVHTVSPPRPPTDQTRGVHLHTVCPQAKPNWKKSSLKRHLLCSGSCLLWAHSFPSAIWSCPRCMNVLCAELQALWCQKKSWGTTTFFKFSSLPRSCSGSKHLECLNNQSTPMSVSILSNNTMQVYFFTFPTSVLLIFTQQILERMEISYFFSGFKVAYNDKIYPVKTKDKQDPNSSLP